MPSPNSEQLNAIKHSGGMILNAGAGSGKTFVLVEHLLYLIEQFFEENQAISGEDLTRRLAKFFSKMVFMTFTKKAAGELSGRIREAIAKKNTDEKWALVESQVNHLFVGTIHSFCSKLLTQGYVTEIGPEINILSDIEFKKKIETFVRNFYEKIGKNLEASDLLLSNLDNITEGFLGVFKSVELRKSWKEWDPSTITNLSFESFMAEVSRLNSLELLDEIDLSAFNGHEKKKWYEILRGFFNIYHVKKFKQYDVLKDYQEFFDGMKRLTGPTERENSPLGEAVFAKIKFIREFFKKYQEDLNAFYQNPEIVKSWAKSVKSLFDYIETQIPYHQGLVFSDLEYYVLKGLENPSLARRLRENYSYFVVDEFQDTSTGQSEIMEKLIGGNYQNLFCVGDLKQAIYGFRGGEIGVFLDYLKKMPKKEELRNNYRATKRLIEFNNKFFEHVFNTSFEFSESKPSQIPISIQNYPDDLEDLEEGEVNRLSLQVDSDQRLYSTDIDRIEAYGIFDLINEVQKNNPHEEICVLYRNRGPSLHLIIKLLSERIGFIAQVKITDKEDPIIGIFKALLEAQNLLMGGKDHSLYLEILIRSYLDFLNILVPENLEELFKQFIKDQKNIGMLESTRKFFFALNISNSNYSNNLSSIESLVGFAGDNPEKIISYLNSNKEGGYDFEFQMGKGKNLIKIMTVHSSKGLEFDHVILGGIHTNEKGVGGALPLFGITPGSFRWKMETKNKKSFQTPHYYLENENIEIKENLESKRLLYVAATRAKKSLSFVDIEGKKYGEGSWINAFRYFDDIDKIIKTIHKTIPLSEIPSKEVNRPLFHRDDLGIILKKNSTEQSFLGTLGDISVTSLAPLSECPRKFYLKNICRMDEDNFAQPFNEEVGATSSSERGSIIHKEISRKIIQKDFSNDPDKSVQFALDFLYKVKSDYEMVSEKPFKFPIFGYMCSGIPDALLIPLKDVPFIIIDFKSGGKKETSHLFQLYAYAYGVYKLGMLDAKKEIKLVILYLDLQEKLEVTTNFENTSKEVFKVWKKLYSLDQVNQNHCPQCSFHGLCYSSVATTSPCAKIN